MSTTTQPTIVWSEHLAEIERRGVSIAAYAREQDVSAASLYGWRSKLREPDSGTRTRVRFAEVLTGSPAPSSSLLVRIGEARLDFDHLPDPGWLAELLVAARPPR